MRDQTEVDEREHSTDAFHALPARPSRVGGRTFVAAAHRRRRCRWVIALVLAASFAAGYWVGPPWEGRDPAVGAGPPASAEPQAPRITDDPMASEEEVGEVSEVRPTDLPEGAPDRGASSSPVRSGPDDFVTPSGNILCTYAGGQLDCHIGSGLAPGPTERCPDGTGDWAGIRLGPRGPSVPWCTNVRLEDRMRTDRELTYGSRWSRDGIACTAQRDGLRCLNDDDGEFLLSRATTRHGHRPSEE